MILFVYVMTVGWAKPVWRLPVIFSHYKLFWWFPTRAKRARGSPSASRQLFGVHTCAAVAMHFIQNASRCLMK